MDGIHLARTTQSDLVLIALSFVELSHPLGPARQIAVFAVMVCMALGAANTVQYGITVSWWMAAIYVLGYIALTLMLYEVTSLTLTA